jgi:DNA-binding NarL/FixJ family response regulator
MNETRIVIADDHPLFRQGLRQMIETDRTLTIVGEAGDGAAALEHVERTVPDVVVLDVDMPNGGGFDVARTLAEKRSPARIIFLTMHKDERFLNAALDLGVMGYLLKDSAALEIISGIKAVAAGHQYVSPALTGLLINRGRRVAALAEKLPALAELTATERRVLKLLADYRTSKEIAAELSVSPRTIEHHRTNICQKLDLKGSHALMKFAAEHKSQL